MTKKSYNSLSGFTSTIGKRSKKIVHFNSQIKKCHTCYKAAKDKKTTPKHNCHVNWHGSVKAMEPDMFLRHNEQRCKNFKGSRG